MNWYPEPLPVPAGLENDRFVFEPLGPEHVDMDYESLMDSKEHLRRWSGTSWPADDFTVAENMDDMEMHAREQRERIAFAYTIMRPDRELTTGCLYIISGSKIPGDVLRAETAVVDFWVRASELEHDLDHAVLDALIDWIETDWSFTDARYGSRVEHPRHLALLGGRLEAAETFESRNRGAFQLFKTAG